jgi:hypothetical protein
MDAHLPSTTSFPVDATDDPLVRIARQAIALGATLVLFLCLVVIVRGLLGAFEAPTFLAFPMLAAAAAELLASLFRLVWSRLYPDATRLRSLMTRLGVPSIGVVCVAVALSMTPASSWAVGFVWMIVLGGEVAWWYPATQRLCLHSEERVATAAVDSEPLDVVDEEELAPNVTQQITRSRNDEGVEVISGVLRAEFAPGERTHNLHVAFCPPLMYEPTVVTHQLDGSPLIVKVAQSEIFGARIELRLTAAAVESELSTIYFEVRPPGNSNSCGDGSFTRLS